MRDQYIVRIQISARHPDEEAQTLVATEVELTPDSDLFAMLRIDAEAVQRLADVQNAEKVHRFEGDGNCNICGKPTESISANPSKWAMWLHYRGGNGKKRPYHNGCVLAAVHAAEIDKVTDWTK